MTVSDLLAAAHMLEPHMKPGDFALQFPAIIPATSTGERLADPLSAAEIRESPDDPIPSRWRAIWVKVERSASSYSVAFSFDGTVWQSIQRT